MPKKKEKEKTLWITVVIHSDLGVGGTVIPPHYLDIVIIDILIQQI
jgi:Flp pilus assembly protein CpaB